MAGYTKTVTMTYPVNGTPVTRTVTTTAGNENKLNEGFASDASDFAIAFNADVSAIKFLIIESTVDATLETNSSGSPDDTLTLLAGVPVLFYPGCGYACPLTADVTGLYITNDSSPAVAGILTIESLVDPTP